MKNTQQFAIHDQEWASELQKSLEAYMMGLHDEELETESGEPYCGCSDCENRELLTFISPRVIQGFLDKKISLL